MTIWTRVKWTEAGQVARLLDWKDDLGGDAVIAPEVFFARLRASGRRADAVFFIGQALPRHETVTWAARCVRDLAEGRVVGDLEREALKMTLLWAQDPSEARRRAAWDAAQAAADRSAERLAALAAFFSGGSLAPDGCPPVPTGPKASGRLAAGAVLVAAHQTIDWIGALDFALDMAEAIAERGLAATPPDRVRHAP
jgi:hypothetical protein